MDNLWKNPRPEPIEVVGNHAATRDVSPCDADETGDIDWDEVRAEFRTNIHRFDISDPAGAVYTASGSVPGEIHNQFALSEHAGHLRVVTTTGDRWSSESESWVRVLAESDGLLVEVGSVGDIGRGEQVQSVRFAGDVGYVVTFRQIDPFYTIDLSDPAEPAVVGELKIPGFSSYLHPLGNGMVLGVGSDADEDGWITGAKVSLFDVSDLNEPREVAVWTAPSGWNEIGWDHRAFLWWAPEQLAVNAAQAKPGAPYKAVAAGNGVSCTIRQDDTVSCWGSNQYGQADAPDGAFREVYVSLDNYACGLRTDGAAICWGSNDYGALPSPIDNYKFKSLATGTGHLCGIQIDDTVLCWGNNYYGQSIAPGGAFSDLAAGYGHTCGIRVEGTVECWGHNEYAQLDAPAGSFTDLAATSANLCGIRADGTVACWSGYDPAGDSRRHLPDDFRRRSSLLRDSTRRYRHLLG